MIQIGGVESTFCQEGILLPKYRNRKGRCIAILFKSTRVSGRFDSPDLLSPHLRHSKPKVGKGRLTLKALLERICFCEVPSSPHGSDGLAGKLLESNTKIQV